MNNKKYMSLMSLMLFTSFALNNNMAAMQDNIDYNLKTEDINKDCHIAQLPNEIQFIIIYFIIESNINNWNDTNKWDVIKGSICKDLENLSLTCTRLGQFNNTKSYIVNRIIKPLRDKNSQYLKLNTQLIEILDRDIIYEEDCKNIIKLIHDGADANLKNNKGNTALMRIANSTRVIDKIDKIKSIINTKTIDINAKNNYNETALMFASYCDHPQIVELFIDKGANINCQDNYGNTALIYAIKYAIRNNLVDAAKILIDKCADVNLENKRGESALSLITISDKDNIKKLLI